MGHYFIMKLYSSLLLLWMFWHLAFVIICITHSVKTFYKWSLSAWNCSVICPAVLLFMLHPLLHASVPLEGVCVWDRPLNMVVIVNRSCLRSDCECEQMSVKSLCSTFTWTRISRSFLCINTRWRLKGKSHKFHRISEDHRIAIWRLRCDDIF